MNRLPCNLGPEGSGLGVVNTVGLAFKKPEVAYGWISHGLYMRALRLELKVLLRPDGTGHRFIGWLIL